MAIENVDGTELRFKHPGRLLVVVLAFIFWGVGFLDLLGHTSAEPDLFGLYSLPFFLFLILYGATIVIWIALFFSATLLERIVSLISYVQQRAWLALLVFAGFGVALWVILEWDRWTRLPGLQFSAFALVLLAAGVLLFANWEARNQGQRWRKIIAYPLLALLALEVVIQVVAYLGLLPGTHTIGGDFAPYERIYYNEEGFRNGYANRYGWSFPDVELDEANSRVLIVGGSQVQALQVEQEQQVSALLSTLVDEAPREGAQTEFVSIGLPGFGLSPFIYDVILSELPSLMAFDEMVVLFHLGDDFQSPSPAANAIAYSTEEVSRADVQSADARLRHDLTHFYLRGYMAFQPVETIRSNYLTPRVVGGLARSLTSSTEAAQGAQASAGFDFRRLRGAVSKSYAVTEPGHAGIRETEVTVIPEGNNFMFQSGENQAARDAIFVARGMLETAQEAARAHDITLRVVTIPVFPSAFYEKFGAGSWEPTLSEYDLFLGERALVDIAEANGIPILPVGQYMYADGLTADEIEGFHYADGHFTPQGHAYFADAIYSCFYAAEVSQLCPD